jgi:hypothetical protein
LHCIQAKTLFRSWIFQSFFNSVHVTHASFQKNVLTFIYLIPSFWKGSFHHSLYIVWQFSSLNGCCVARVLSQANWKHIWTCSNLCLHELQTKWVIRSQTAEEVVHVRGILLVEMWVTRIWTSG